MATNAVLEHRGAKTALITTKGFRDVLELRRIRAPQIYDVFFDKPEILVERYLRFEVDERIAADGTVLAPLDEADLWRIKERLEAEAVESIAVCFIHSYAHPQHEMVVGRFLRRHFPTRPCRFRTRCCRSVRSTNERQPQWSTLTCGPSCTCT